LNACKGHKGKATQILDFALRWRWEFSFSTAREGVPSTHRVGDWMGPRASLDMGFKGKVPYLAWNWTSARAYIYISCY